MRRVERAAWLWVLGFLLPSGLPAAEPITRWQARERSARLEIELPAGCTAPLDLLVALPPEGGWAAAALSLDGESADPAALLRLSEPFVYRRVRGGQLHLAGGATPWRSAAIELRFERPLPSQDEAFADPALTGLFVNPAQLAEAKSAAGAAGDRDGDEVFDTTGHWIRIDILRSGVYHLDYHDLWLAGVALGADTQSFRLLGSGGKLQPFRIEWPHGSWARQWRLPEIPIQVTGGASFNEATELSFYVPGVEGFASEFEAEAGWEEYQRNFYAPWASYYLTWGSEPGLRVLVDDAAPQGTETRLETLPAKLHREQNFVYSNHYLHEDGWAWHFFFPHGNPDSFVESFPLLWPDPAQPFRLRVGFDAPIYSSEPGGPHHLRAYLGSADPDHLMFDETFSINSSLGQVVLDGERVLPPDIAGEEDANFILQLPKDPPQGLPEDYGYLLWYELFYETRPRTRFSAPMELYVPDRAEPARIVSSGWSHEPEIWDVTDPFAPALLAGGAWAGDSLDFRVSAPGRRHLIGVDPLSNLGYHDPERVRQVSPRPLRNDDGRPHMIVVYFDDFQGQAERYADWRRSHFPLLGSGEVELVSVGDIYANFGSGMQDPAALRNFLKYRYDTPGSRLTYLLLLGDADYDYRNFLGRETLGDGTNCLVPALSDRFRTDHLLQTYTTDDYICCLDVEDDSLSRSVPDLAVGRLPAGSLDMAEEMVDMCIAYERDLSPDVWMNRAVLAADDYFTHCSEFDGIPHTTQAETLFVKGLPPELDVEKIYMAEWDCDFAGFKPQAQQKLFSMLQDGVLLFNYVGHGGNDVLSDEQLLLTNRLPSLSNAERRFLFISASCNVGKYDDPSNQSMSETMLSLPGGGAIGTMASSDLSGAYFNNILNRNFLQQLFPARALSPSTPIGLSLLRAKVNTQLVDMAGQQVGAQNERYAILGDPALTLKTAGLDVDFDESSPESLQVGGSYAFSGRITRDGVLAPDFDGILHLSLRASADTSGYTVNIGDIPMHVSYHLPGPEIFRGRIAVSEGRFVTPAFFIPGLPDSSLGPYARIRAFAIGESQAAAGAIDSLICLPGLLPPDDTLPEVSLSLAGGATHASPGMELTIRASANSGINFVGTHPRNSIVLEYVEAGEVENLTQQFEYDLGSATTGEVRSILPGGLPIGPNTLVTSVADNLGNVGRDTLRVEILEEGRADLKAAQPFPNPFAKRCAISFEVTAQARVDCAIYTLSGRRIRSLSLECPAPGRYAFDWSGKDEAGDEVANGSYLFRLSADFSGRKREATGTVVRMRD